ncbi:heavy-metal-associated domain-containing protein [Thermobifida fusca]|jgi:copper chaperone|uniref:Metal-binding protein n=2 Tax=Thermobifida fusca TaxID=2021 RepID=A0A9P2WRT6_THEFU|nr:MULTISPECIES: cation transporter [Thermobifida]AAZ54989.1 putative metal-binding protein [Thermobifida fusca YX]EOR71958.1 metal-binding protein [Thermobifida fusca TM51]MBO2528360.1 copper chaperone [Thermobifida sp.]PPS92582.1 cation-transporting ATPase [Thermobifida fusca]PZN65095.1 MAG: copper chaperone [Thermobifida fusca]
MASTTITVTGMTCGHCVSSVKEEISELPGVTDVRVDLESGRVEIDSTAPLSDEQIRAAVAEAGYEVVA